MIRPIVLATAALAAGAPVAAAHEASAPGAAAHASGARSATAPSTIRPTLDITSASVTVTDATARFRITTKSRPGAVRPRRTGHLAGAGVQSYVWPTSLDPSVVGFPAASGILSLAVTSHPDFDDTPLFDEDGDGDRADDGREWHSHWVVLHPDASCGGGLKVVDIADGATPELPATWPGLPLLIDSPGWQPVFGARRVEVVVPFHDRAVLRSAHFDAVTAALQVNADLHAPLLCVTQAQDVLSGDLSLPGVFAAAHGQEASPR